MGYAIQSGVILQKCGYHWCRLGTGQVVDRGLVNRSAGQVVHIYENYVYTQCDGYFTQIAQGKGEVKIATTCNVAGNGLWYDNCNAGNIAYNNAPAYCASKGMRVPSLSETTAQNTVGVPSCTYVNNNWTNSTWTTTASKQCTYTWIGGGISPFHYNLCGQTDRTLRCVR